MNYFSFCVIFILTIYSCENVENNNVNGFCSRDNTCETGSSLLPKYLLYDVNPPEGFNLRRDVYMRLAIFMREFNQKNGGDWHLVLPPWNHLYHWKSRELGDQVHLPWKMFFDVDSMVKFAPVIEMDKFFKEKKDTELDQVFVLQHYKDAFSSDNWEWKDKWNIEDCHNDHGDVYIRGEDGSFGGWFWGFNNITAKDVECVSFQGSIPQLSELIQNVSPLRSVMVDHAEVVLHDRFGDKTYWECRRSMRFSKELREEAKRFRERLLNSTDKEDNTELPKDWRKEKDRGRKAVGGNYLSVHLRRQDFIRGRKKGVPSLEDTASQLTSLLDKLSLNTVFLATDAPHQEVEKLKELMGGYRVIQYLPDTKVKKKFKDGGIAIIDQIICSHARYFVGTHLSTFSFRIQEEREIMGFPVETTFNRICPRSEKDCEHPTRWKIVY